MIPLNGDAWTAILELRERVKLLFGSEPRPGWYVFPHGEGQGPIAQPKNRLGPRVSVTPDPTRPMSTWRTAWRSLTKTAGLAGLRFHDLRHHAITELAESSASDQTIMAIAGHVSPKMLAHYSHVRLEARRKAVEALVTQPSTEVTSQAASQKADPIPQVLENLVDVAGIEPATPCLQSVNQVPATECNQLQSCFVFFAFRGLPLVSRFQLSAMVYNRGVHQNVHQLFRGHFAGIVAPRARQRGLEPGTR